MSNTVSTDLARRLQVAGLQWEPKAGDWCIGLPDGTQPRLVTGIDDGLLVVWLEENGAGQYIDTATGTYCLWLPTLADCVDRLRALGTVHMVATYDGALVESDQAMKVRPAFLEMRQFAHTNPAEATGLALAAILEGEKA